MLTLTNILRKVKKITEYFYKVIYGKDRRYIIIPCYILLRQIY